MWFSMNFPMVVAGWGFKYPKVSPIKGKPLLPGGRFREGFLVLNKLKVQDKAKTKGRRYKKNSKSDMSMRLKSLGLAWLFVLLIFGFLFLSLEFLSPTYRWTDKKERRRECLNFEGKNYEWMNEVQQNTITRQMNLCLLEFTLEPIRGFI